MNNREQKQVDVVEKPSNTQPVQHHPHAPHVWSAESGRPIPLHIQQQIGMSDYHSL